MARFNLEQIFKRAVACHHAGRLAEADALFRQCLQANPGHAHSWHRLGQIAIVSGRLGEALHAISLATSIAPEQSNFIGDLGVVNFNIGRMPEAQQCFEKALALDERSSQWHRYLADVYMRLKQTDHAAVHYQRSLELDPRDGATHNNYGNVYRFRRDLPAAAECYRQAIKFAPDLMVAYSNLSEVLTRLGDPDAGMVPARQAIERNPRYSEAYKSLGVAYWQKGLHAEAEEQFRAALAIDPNNGSAELCLAIALLQRGAFEEGWTRYERRWLSPDVAAQARKLTNERWQGQPVPGKRLLIYSDQGIGDAIHFLRYVPLVQERSQAAEVVLECQREVAGLLAQRVATLVKGSSDAELSAQYDLHIPLISLPAALRQYEPVGMSEPYLRADEASCQVWRERLAAFGDGLRVGLVWAGNRDHSEDARRSIAPESYLPLTTVSGARFFSLQITGLAPCLAEAGVEDLAPHLKSFGDTAALLTEMDLLVSVDSSPVHLAGALGRPVWALVTRVPDWRWGFDSERTPLYPSVRLFRQPSPGDWPSVLEAVREALQQEVARSRA